MTISNATISSIQKTGAAAYAASEKLKKEADNYAKRVREALNDNPFDLNNDALIENWKIVAKLVQTLTGMENELKNIHRIASNLTTEEAEIQPTHKVLSLLAPVASDTQPKSKASKNQDAVDVTPKKSKRAKPAAPVSKKTATKAAAKAVKAVAVAATKPAAPKAPAKTPTKAPAKASAKATKALKVTRAVKTATKPAKAAKAATASVAATLVPVKATKPAKARLKSPAKPTSPVDSTASSGADINTAMDTTGVTTAPAKQTAFGTNADKLNDYMATILNAESFIAVNLKTATEATGIPMGSIHAAIKKVIELGKVITDGNGGYKLAA